MKKIVFKGCFLMSILSVVTLFNSCSTIKELEYNVTENPLQMHADDVTLQINGKFIEKD